MRIYLDMNPKHNQAHFPVHRSKRALSEIDRYLAISLSSFKVNMYLGVILKYICVRRPGHSQRGRLYVPTSVSGVSTPPFDQANRENVSELWLKRIVGGH